MDKYIKIPNSAMFQILKKKTLSGYTLQKHIP